MAAAAGMDGILGPTIGGGGGGGGAVSEQPPAAAATRVVERLNPAVQQQLNLESVKTRAISLFKAISRILEDFDAIARSNAVPKWYACFPCSLQVSTFFGFSSGFLWLLLLHPRQDILGQFSMVNLELYNIVEDIKKVSKAFVVHPKNVNAENAASNYF